MPFHPWVQDYLARNQGNEGLTTIFPSKTDLSEPETLKSSGVEEESIAQSTTRDPRKKFDLPARVEGGLAGETAGRGFVEFLLQICDQEIIFWFTNCYTVTC